MSIESRLAKLERENRLLRVVVFVGLVLAALPWTLASRAEIEETIRAKGFTLVDDDGVVRGAWSFEPDTKTTLLRIQSPNGSAAIVLDTNQKRATSPGATPNIALTASLDGNSLKMNTGVVAIEDRRGRTIFVAPPKPSVVPAAKDN